MTFKLSSPAFLAAASLPSTTSYTGINVVSESASLSSARVSAILYLSAPGAVKLGVSLLLSYKPVSSDAVTIDSVTVKPTTSSGAVVYFETTML